MKICSKCKKEKPLTEFCKYKSNKDGLNTKCKKCKREDDKIWKKNNPKKIKRYMRKDYLKNRKKRIKDVKAWQKKHKYYSIDIYRKNHPGSKHYEKNSKKPATLMKQRHRKNNPEKYKARNMVTNSVKAGKLKKSPCVICGDKKSQAHHSDYSKPLNIIWLCRKHHLVKHEELKKIA